MEFIPKTLADLHVDALPTSDAMNGGNYSFHGKIHSHICSHPRKWLLRVDWLSVSCFLCHATFLRVLQLYTIVVYIVFFPDWVSLAITLAVKRTLNFCYLLHSKEYITYTLKYDILVRYKSRWNHIWTSIWRLIFFFYHGFIEIEIELTNWITVSC